MSKRGLKSKQREAEPPQQASIISRSGAPAGSWELVSQRRADGSTFSLATNCGDTERSFIPFLEHCNIPRLCETTAGLKGAAEDPVGIAVNINGLVDNKARP